MSKRYDFLTSFGLSRECIHRLTGVQVDSRYIQPGHLFFALEGKTVDGHAFLKEAQKKGAIAAVVSRPVSDTDLELIVVKDVLATLQQMARLFLQQTDSYKIAVTGTVGKTTTKEMVSTLLSSKYTVGKTFKNQNSQIGLPLSILNLEGQEQVYVLEMGMTRKGQIQNLCDLVEPNAAILTKASLVHAENFHSLDQIVQAKLEIFDHKKTNIKILDYELYQFASVRKIQDTISFSLTDRRADFYLDGKILYEKNKQVAIIDPPFSEEHFMHDLLAAMALCRTVGLDYYEITENVSKIETPKMRFEKIQIGDVLFINDAYNASLVSMKAAIRHMPKLKGKRTIGVLGSMLELGRFSRDCHKEVALEAVKYLDTVFCIGKECLTITESFQAVGKQGFFFEDLPSLVRRLKEYMQSKDVVLVKGSRSMNLEKLFEMIT